MKPPVLCCSYPKSGRTWLRFVLANYFNEINSLVDSVDYNNVFTLFPNSGSNPQRGLPAYQYMDNNDIPLILFDHSNYNANFDQVSVVFLIRGIFDTLVSNYFQAKNRLSVFNGDIKSYVRDDDLGVDNLIRYYNSWSTGLKKVNHQIISYEDMHAEIETYIEKLLIMVGAPVDKGFIEVAVKKSSFDNMKSIEIKNGFVNQNQVLKTNDNNALRAREGKIGGYTQHLDAEDISHITKQCDKYLSIDAKELLKSVMA